MLPPLNKNNFYLYCMGEAWFNAREYSNELKIFNTLQNAFVQGMDRLIRSQENAQLSKSIQTAQQVSQSSNNAFLQRLASAVVPVVQVFTAVQKQLVQQMQQLSQQAGQMAQRLANAPARLMQTVFPNLSGFLVGVLGLAPRTRETEEKINKEEFDADAETYADNFIRRSQASAGAKNS